MPGNHELWVKRKTPAAPGMPSGIFPGDSLAKLRAIVAMCDALGVRTRPTRIPPKTPGAPGVVVVPLYSWYHRWACFASSLFNLPPA